MMLADDQSPQSDRLSSEFAQVAKRFTQQRQQNGKAIAVRLPADLYDNLMAFALEEVISVDSVIEEAIANYLPSRNAETKAEVRVLEESATHSPTTPKHFQDLAKVYEAACHQIWMVRRKIEEWKGDRFCEAFFEVKELRKQIKREGDRNV